MARGEDPGQGNRAQARPWRLDALPRAGSFFRDVELPELNGYHAVAAQAMAERRRAVHRRMVVHPMLKLAVVDRLKAGWSPEQIAGRMRLERHPVRVSHETIYRFAYSKSGLSEELCRHLLEHRRRRRPRDRTTTPWPSRTTGSAR